MLNTLKQSLWQQFGASIQMLENAITLWPQEDWHTHPQFFYNAYHCLVFLDYYLTNPPEGFTSPLPFTLAQPGDNIPAEALDDVLPNRIYSKQELLDYVQYNRQKCHTLIANLTEDSLAERWIEDPGGMNYPMLELLLYNMRHVQHHAAQLNMLLRNHLNNAPRWVARAKEPLEG